jgi:tRNA threonylcarbamoyladenosine biosynthesis protein TsaB
MPTPKPESLTRISHQISAAAADPGMSAALRSVGFLDVLPSTPAESSRRAPCIHARLRRLATKSGEKCGLTPKILAFDTSTQRGSVALLEGREVCAELRLHTPQTHSTLLLSSIRLLLRRLNWELNELNLVAVGIGPGSFTGIRIGIATALGISQSLSIPFIGISGLDVLAHQAAMLSGNIGVALNAHREQIFYAEYIGSKGRIRRSLKATLMNISDLERHLANRHLYIAGDLEECRIQGLAKSPPGWPRAIHVDLFLASGIGRLAYTRKNGWRSGEFLLPEPTYIRPPDALRNKSRKS